MYENVQDSFQNPKLAWVSRSAQYTSYKAK